MHNSSVCLHPDFLIYTHAHPHTHTLSHLHTLPGGITMTYLGMLLRVFSFQLVKTEATCSETVRATLGSTPFQ